MSDAHLANEIERIAHDAGARAVAVAYHDYQWQRSFDYQGNRWFHAASTIKVPVLLGVFDAISRDRIQLDSRVHVRNRFISVADGRPFRVESSRDAGDEVHALIGKTMRVGDLARHMIVTSSNLATNLLVDLVGIEPLREALSRLVAEGVEFRRGVEDDAAYESGISNRVTALGLVRTLRTIEERTLSEAATEAMLDILHAQEFRSGIPSGLPETARVANKTGEISTVAHDTGLVYLDDRKPYALAILTEWDPAAATGRRETLARLSRAVFEHLTREAADA